MTTMAQPERRGVVLVAPASSRRVLTDTGEFLAGNRTRQQQTPEKRVLRCRCWRSAAPSRRRRRCVRVSRLVVEVPNSKRAEQDCADEQDGGAGCQDVQLQGHAHAVVSQDVDDGESLTDKFSPPKRQRLCTASTRNCRNDLAFQGATTCSRLEFDTQSAPAHMPPCSKIWYYDARSPASGGPWQDA